MRTNKKSLVKNVILTPDEYFVTAFNDDQIKDINEFCSSKSTPLVMDTTFDICNLWLTDTAYQNLRLLNRAIQHPWFYGPSLFHMKKSNETFAGFAMDMLVSSNMISPKFLGTDMEKAMFGGFSKIFPDLKHLLCVKHLSDRDNRKLTNIGARYNTRILSDIYGCNDGITRELGLASAEDADDFKAKLLSLEESWNNLAPGFHDWFSTHRANQFIECVIQSDRNESGVADLFYNNAIESLHSTLKKKITKKLKLVEAVAMIEELVSNQKTEEVRAIYQTGEYRLSEEYKHFEV